MAKQKTNIQKYICSGCKWITSETTGTIAYYSKLSFDVWKNIIDNLLDGFSIRRIAEEKNSIPTSFQLRHKILFTLDNYIKNIQLGNSAQLDEKYFKINLKGTKPKNMPRFSKRRTTKGNSTRGISHHQVCIILVIDENDNLFFKIGELGRDTTQMLEDSISPHLGNILKVTVDCLSRILQKA